MNKNFKVILSYVLVFAVLLIIGSNFLDFTGGKDDPIYSDILEYFENEQVKFFEINESNLKIAQKSEKWLQKYLKKHFLKKAFS